MKRDSRTACPATYALRVEMWILLGAVQLAAIGCGGGSGGGGGTSQEPTGLPAVVAARALSSHYMEVAFAGPVGSDGAQPARYLITAPDGTVLAVRDARVSDDPTRVILTTDAQQPVTYRLSVQNARTVSVTAAAAGSNNEPVLETAVALNNTSVLLTFDQPVAGGATVPSFYRIVVPGEDPIADVGALVVQGASLSSDGMTVTLTTSSQKNLLYSVIVTNVAAKSGGAFIDPTRNTTTFFGVLPPDAQPPELRSAEATGSTAVLLTFSEPLLSLPLDNAAEDASNYTLSPAVVVIGAQLNESHTQVLLTTLPLAAGVPYLLTVDNVKDLAGNPIMQANQTAFTFEGEAGLGDKDLPRVVGAASTGNTGVVVQFSRPMGDSATEPGAYVIVQENVNPEAGSLAVIGAAFTGLDRTAVALTTRSQNEVTYTLTVVNVQDFIGLPMAPKEIVGGVLLDPSSASFPGTPPVCPPLSSCTLQDTDGDGLTDNDEQRGWVVIIQLANGDTIRREVTSDPTFEDTDGDGLSDALEKNLSTDPRQTDTDGDGLRDDEEFNAIYSDPAAQDSDSDGIADNSEVEFFKTNALLADSDGDGYGDSQELFEMNRDPRIADLPQYQIAVGSTRLQIDERYTTTDENGNTQTEDSSTSSVLQNDRSSATSHLSQTVGHFLVQLELGVDWCQADNACAKDIGFFQGVADRFKLIATGSGGVEWTTADTTESARSTMSAFENSLNKGRELSTVHAVTREVVGASLSAEVSLQNLSNVAFQLSNLEIRVATTDPDDPTRLVPVATLFPDGTLQSGDPVEFNIGPRQTRGPVIFSNLEVFPNLVEDLMRAPRGMVFTVANFDQSTEDGRNFAFGLQQVQERTAEVRIDFGDGEARRFHAITAGVLNRPRDELRCAPTGDHPDQSCLTDSDCGTSTPCEGGKIVGGFSDFGGTGRPRGTRLDFVLQDILHMRKSTPAVILAGPNLVADTSAQGDDVQVVAMGDPAAAVDAVMVAPGRNGVLDTVPAGDDFSSQAPRIVAGEDGTADTAASGDDEQVLPVGTMLLAPGTAVVAPGPNRRLDTTPENDDVVRGPDGVLPGNDGAVQSVAQGDDVQLVPVGTTGVPEDVVIITAGHNSILDTPVLGDDVAAVVTGYEVSKTCNANTPFAILAGPNNKSDTQAETGVCTLASPPHFVGESCSRTAANPDAGCGVGTNVPTSEVDSAVQRRCFGGPDTGSACFDDSSCTDGTCNQLLPLRPTDADSFPSSGVIAVGDQEARYIAKTGADLVISSLTLLSVPIPNGTSVTLVTGRCTADTQEVLFGDDATSPQAIVVSPGTDQFLASIPGGDDVYVAPGIPCTLDADCVAGADSGECTGPQNVVRVEQRRNGQFRRFWALLLADDTQFQTDFGDILVRPGDAIALTFIQDVDRDGLIAAEEFLHRSSDFKKDTDGDSIGDFAEIRLGWDVGVVGQPIRHVFPDPRLRRWRRLDRQRRTGPARDAMRLRRARPEVAPRQRQSAPRAGAVDVRARSPAVQHRRRLHCSRRNLVYRCGSLRFPRRVPSLQHRRHVESHGPADAGQR